MDVENVIERARAAASRGDLRVALTGLKDAIAFEPAADAPRLALAMIYRDEGKPDQAGRWGIQTNGWTTETERRAFVASLRAHRGKPEDVLVRLLQLNSARELSADAMQILVDWLVARRGKAVSYRREQLEVLGPLLQKSAACLILAGLIFAFLVVLPGSDTAGYLVRWILFLSIVVFLAGLTARLVVAVGEGGFSRVARASLGFFFVLAAAVVSAISLVPPAP